jgi:TonB family protein
VWVAALVLETLLPMCSLDLGAVWGRVLGELLPAAGWAGAIGVVTGPVVGHRLEGLRLPTDVEAGIALAFAGSAIYFAARLGWGLWRTEALRRRAVPVTLEGEARATWLRVCKRDSGSRLQLPEIREARGVFGPVTVGMLRPAVLLPAGFLEGVDADDLEAVLAHELAHVRRRDFAKNAAYQAISLAVAWHPAVWLTRARVAESREMVCDAMAADAVAGPERYARSLLRLAATISDGMPTTTLHAIGIFDANSFERRVMNLTMRRIEMKKVQRVGIAVACAVVTLATCATAMALRVEIGSRVSEVAAKSGSGAPENKKVGVGQLKIVSRVMPVYPAEAKANHDTLDGPVVLAVTIGKDGGVEEIHVEKSLRGDYDKSALDAVRNWRWEPYLLNGEPTEVDSTVTVTYSIPHDEK